MSKDDSQVYCYDSLPDTRLFLASSRFTAWHRPEPTWFTIHCLTPTRNYRASAGTSVASN